ncbi:uncharacterized protein LOC127715186 [Mytilus californianus]|uniref:uncharacterized protein LOC127715186 n=1 Tax=Mytilus californianus TaxID=6549 RepID=UPI0022456AA4|nr:uncharacterized protein LOC127715186 [Mytilus californianus]
MGARTSKLNKKTSNTNQSDVATHDITFDRRPTVGQSGLYYYYPLGPTKEVKTPPKLSRHQNVKNSAENLKEMAEELEEKMMIANILREENLRSKGKAARDFTERQARVKERKAQMTEEKIQKIQDKMVLDEVRLLNRPKMNKPRIRSHSIPHLSKIGTNTKTHN